MVGSGIFRQCLCFSIEHPHFLVFFLLHTTTVVSNCFTIGSGRIKVTTRLTTCYYYRFEEEDYNGLLKPFSPRATASKCCS